MAYLSPSFAGLHVSHLPYPPHLTANSPDLTDVRMRISRISSVLSCGQYRHDGIHESAIPSSVLAIHAQHRLQPLTQQVLVCSFGGSK
mmetsp:Transcript_13864/g.18791  ORF Transcript_13864/g.18791 Transcript_13864/m.18791 type:complete len:88 (+) Transcript_13864:1431-1694(+)